MVLLSNHLFKVVKVQLIVVLACCLVGSFGAQIGQAQTLTPSTYNHGKVKLWNNPKAVFTFTNTTSQRMLFLPIQYQRDLYIHLPEGYIEPGQSVDIEVLYYTEEEGPFSITQELYVSGSNDPIYLRLKGKIQSFHPDAKTACPRVNPDKNENQRTVVTTVTVYDKSTGKVINGVDILISGAQSDYFIEHTKKYQVPLKNVAIGLYEVEISKPGYKSLTHVQYINPNVGHLVFELEPNPLEDPSVPDASDKEGDDVVIEIDKVQKNDADAIERIRKMMDERFKDRKIIERDVIVVKDNQDTTPKETPIASSDTVVKPAVPEKDFDEGGLLNSKKYASNNVVFLIDVSGSMKIDDKLESMKTSMKSLVSVLRPQDMVTIIIYSRTARIKLQSTPGDRKDSINYVIDELRANGSSYGAEGLTMAYEFAVQNFITGGNNQVILATDGLFNSPEVTEDDLYAMARLHANYGVNTSVVGFGKKEEPRLFMQKLATSGSGSFIQIADQSAAESALITEIMKNARKS
ncbi:MAG: VWA domain-containing protein [Flavobacteriales bacterium]|nr:VWA domain-containing protein [Flavobacteriales bacterium]